MGLIKFIRNNLPESLEKVSREMRMKDALVQRIYAAIPQFYKNRYRYKEAMSKVRMIFFYYDRGTDIYHLIDMTGVEAKDLTKWKQLSEKAKNYKASCG